MGSATGRRAWDARFIPIAYRNSSRLHLNVVPAGLSVGLRDPSRSAYPLRDVRAAPILYRPRSANIRVETLHRPYLDLARPADLYAGFSDGKVARSNVGGTGNRDLASVRLSRNAQAPEPVHRRSSVSAFTVASSPPDPEKEREVFE